jgi:hypothetical protein
VPLRFLLDENFPPRLEVPDHRVEYVDLGDFDASLVGVSTPDWMIYLAAQAGGFDGVVSRDRAQLDQAAEHVALAHTDLSVVTWRRQIDDPIAQWGHLLAYIPRIVTIIENEGPQIVILPSINLDADKHAQTRAYIRREVSLKRTTMSELRAESLPVMRAELGRRKREDLAALFDTT